MNLENFYRDVDPRWCQGDIIREVPHIHLKPPLRAVRREFTPKWGEKLIPFEYAFSVPGEGEPANTPPPGGFKFDTGDQVVAFCQVGLGMVLSHSCEMDKDSKHREIALIRPLGHLPAQDQQTIRENRNLSYCYLPAYSNIIAESYIDFRRKTTLHPDFLLNTERVLSLTDEAVNYILIQSIRYTTRRDVKPEALEQLSILP
jgi:hypothetical protein